MLRSMLPRARIPKWPLLAIAALTAASLSGCDPGAAAGPAEEPDPAPTSPPQRVLCADAGAADLVLALIDEERVVCVPEQASLWSGHYQREGASPPARTFAGYTPEQVLSREPDLVVAHGSQSLETTGVLREEGVPVLVLPDPGTPAELARSIERLGRVLHAQERARALVERVGERLDALAAGKGEEELTALVYSNYGTGGWAAGSGTSADLMLSAAGLVNAAAAAGIRSHGEIDVERLLVLDPDVLVVGASYKDPRRSATLDYLKGERALAGLTALRTGRVVVLPQHLITNVSHWVVDAAERLAMEVREGEDG